MPLRILVEVVSGVLFDFGGTLARYPQVEIFQTILEKEGISVNDEDLRRAINRGDKYWEEKYGQSMEWNNDVAQEVDGFILREAGVGDRADEVASIAVRRWEHLDKEYDWIAFPDVEPCLAALRREGIQMGVVSNCPSKEFLIDNLCHIGIQDFFMCLVASGSEGVLKPDPEIFRIASRRIGLPESSLIHVGDSPKTDIEGARAAGLRTVLVDREESFPHYTGTKLTDLRDLTSLTYLVHRAADP